jgi:uncharacterized protein YfaS (alpha-2-macroglobulin family)
MNSKKQVLAASILAIGLAVGLGTISYALFSPIPTTTKLQSAMDVFTQEGGQGINVSGGIFAPFDNVSVYAHLTQEGNNLENAAVAFAIYRPDNSLIARTTLTDSSGIAESDVYLLPSEGQVIGTWHVFANTTVENEAVSDTLSFQCESQKARIDLFSKKNGVASISFLPNDTVLLEARLSYKNASIAGTPVYFDVRTPDGKEFLNQEVTTNSLGVASITFQITAPSDPSQPVWQAFASSEVDGQVIQGTTSFGCFSLTPTIDIFTQKGGTGPNTPGGYYAINETVDLYAQVMNESGQGVPNQLIAFAVIGPNGTKPVYADSVLTNSSGIASVSFRIPPDSTYVGTYEAYANTRYQGQVALSDTLTFIAGQG